MIRIRNDRTADTNASTHGSDRGRHDDECTHRTGRLRSAPTPPVRRRRGGGRRRRGSGIKLLHPFSSAAVSAENHMATIQPDRYMFLGGTDGWIRLPPDPGDPAVPPRHPGAARAPSHDLHLRVPQRHRTRRDASGSPRRTRPSTRAPLFWVNAVRPGQPGRRVPGPADEPRPRRCGPTCSTRTPSTGTGSAT